MARYRIELIDRSDKPGGSGITNRQECDLASDEEAIQRAEEFYRAHETSVIGYRVIDVTTRTTVCRFRH